ncbi:MULTISPECIES: hypothetical protein [Exiguobacterium]|uniref:hypothetical protein n=1 Tax=Exiguobacterium TaxID=33986 RepID=UPI001BE9A665|nr:MULTISPECIES: hypothetical protein [Exiguobacterium]MCT4776820.1 hypothetical protein [Exiguobacterium aquaticum]MCT4790289.1 hypothetical protein [Exiguobacterium mexicanum]
MARIKSFTFWLTLFAVLICLYNVSGADDKSILFFLTSPPFWIMETHWFVETITHPSNIPMWVKYGVTILFWAMVGTGLDRVFLKKDDNSIVQL